MLSLNDVWNSTLDYIEKTDKIPSASIDLWLKNIVPVSLENDIVTLRIQTNFQKNLIQSKYSDIIKEGLSASLAFDVDISFQSLEDVENNKPSFQNQYSTVESNQSSVTSPLEVTYDYTFQNFIVGSTNQFAHAACVAVSKNPGRAYNPLFIYGNSGLGKTHLLKAIGSEIKTTFPDYKIVYVSGETFTNEFINSLSNNTVNEFKEKYRNVDILLMDDIQFISNKFSIQEEFFHTFNLLYENQKQIVLISDRPPKEIKALEDRLRTRFEWGLISDIQPPDYETRIAIIKRKAELLNLNLPEDVLDFIANKLKNNIRQLEGTVKNIKAQTLLNHASPTISMASNAIKDIVVESVPIPQKVEKIISEVTKFYNIDPSDIRGNKRSAEIAIARHVAMYIIRRVTNMSNENIGKEFGGKHHSTVIAAVDKVEAMMKKDSKFKNNIYDIISIVENYNG